MKVQPKVVAGISEIQTMFATSIANAMVEAQENLQDGSLGIGEYFHGVQ